MRPPLANLDKLFVVSSVSDPQPSTLIIDKTIAAAELKGIEPVLVFTKTDLDDASALRDAQRTVSVLRNRIPRIHLVVNRVQPRLLRRLHTTIDDAMDAAGLPLLGIVPEDPQVMLCANQGQPLILRASRGAAVAISTLPSACLARRPPL